VPTGLDVKPTVTPPHPAPGSATSVATANSQAISDAASASATAVASAVSQVRQCPTLPWIYMGPFQPYLANDRPSSSNICLGTGLRYARLHCVLLLWAVQWSVLFQTALGRNCRGELKLQTLGV
jgi:hypothetical protein